LQVDRYAVVGNPIAQSKSPLIHQLFAHASKQTLEYGAILSPLDDFVTSAQAFHHQGGKGLNITTPFKIDAFNFVTNPSERAKAAGAVNAIKFEDSRIFGENFDGIGLVRDVVVNLSQKIKASRILILGAGGATRGLLGPFLDEQPAALVIANRDVGKAHVLLESARATASLAGTQLLSTSYEALSLEAPFDLVINATSASLRSEFPPIKDGIFTPTGLAYELAYGRGLTPFLQVAKDAGVANVADGLGMLVEQAAQAFFWWRGVRPETKWVIDKIRKS
jgi:shikimate dehydrogenase